MTCSRCRQICNRRRNTNVGKNEAEQTCIPSIAWKRFRRLQNPNMLNILARRCQKKAEEGKGKMTELSLRCWTSRFIHMLLMQTPPAITALTRPEPVTPTSLILQDSKTLQIAFLPIFMPRAWKFLVTWPPDWRNNKTEIYIEARAPHTTFVPGAPTPTAAASSTRLVYFCYCGAITWHDIRLKENEFDRNTSPCGKAAIFRVSAVSLRGTKSHTGTQNVAAIRLQK